MSLIQSIQSLKAKEVTTAERILVQNQSIEKAPECPVLLKIANSRLHIPAYVARMPAHFRVAMHTSVLGKRGSKMSTLSLGIRKMKIGKYSKTKQQCGNEK